MRASDDGADPKVRTSSRARVAYHLATQVGEGESFTMQSVRDACPGIEQIDRRMRELREVGWVIRTYKDHAGLQPQELFLEKIGDRVWEPNYKGAAAQRISGPLRREVFARDGNRCQECGIGAGEEYPDYPGRFARMTVGHWLPLARGGTNAKGNLRTECSMCNETGKNATGTPVDPQLVRVKMKSLSRAEKAVLLAWMRAGRREFSPLEDVWSQYRSLPAEERASVVDYLEGMFTAG